MIYDLLIDSRMLTLRIFFLQHFVAGSDLMADAAHSVEHHTDASIVSSASATASHQYETLTSVMPIDDYPSTSSGHFSLANINPGFCEVDDGNQQKMLKNLMQHQAFMTAMLQVCFNPFARFFL